MLIGLRCWGHGKGYCILADKLGSKDETDMFFPCRLGANKPLVL